MVALWARRRYKSHMQVKALYLGCMAKPWISVAARLSAECSIEPAYFVYWADDKDFFEAADFRNCFFQSLEAAWKGLGFPKDTMAQVIEPHVRKAFADYELIAIRMMDRLDPDGQSFSSRQRERFYLRTTELSQI